MAMEATHVLFAKNLKPLLKIKNESSFFAGSIYPDSRYVTGLLREKTHGPGTPQDPFIDHLSDFEKGWATHLLYDRIAGSSLRQLLKQNPDSSTEALITMTAMKLLEDQQSYERLKDDVIIFQTMEIPPCPLGEPKEKLETYYHSIQQLYLKRPGVEDYRHFFENFISSKEYVEQIFTEMEKLLRNIKIKKQILAIYDQVINGFLST